MSFEWLNIPGISVSDSASTSGSSIPQPPNVSFNFGEANVDQVRQSDATVPYQSQNPAIERRYNTEDLNGWSGNRGLVENGRGNDIRHHSGYHGSQQYLHQNQQQNSQNLVSQPSYFPQNMSKSPYSHNDKEKNERHDFHSGVGQDDYRESPEDLRVPLSLSHSQLTKEEIQTYLRWYTYITARKHVKLVRLGDVFDFLSNFKLPDQLKARITSIFRTCKNALNIGQFFAVLRLISKALLENTMPERKMILEKTPIPKPRPILCTNAKEETYEEIEEENVGNSDKVDFDSFASMLLTGNKPGKKRLRRKVINSMHKSKKVRFSEKITFQDPPNENDDISNADAPVEEDDVIDFSLPMNQLLKRMARKKERNSALVSQLPSEQHETEEEKEVLEDMKDSLSHFKQIQTPDMPGVSEQMASSAIPHPLTIGTANGNNGAQQSQQLLLQPLKPTSTGSANNLFKSAFQPVPSLLNPSGSAQNQAPMQPLKPTATGSANYLVRNQFDSQIPPQRDQQPQQEPQQSDLTGSLQPLRPTATGSANYLMKSQFDQQPINGSQARLSPNQIVSPAISPDSLSSPQNTNRYMNLNQLPSNQVPLQYQQPVIQHNTSPPPSRYQQQPILQPQTSPPSSNTNLMIAPNPAQNYFRSLLSPSPSPAPSQQNLNPSAPHGNLNISQSSSPYLSSSSLPQSTQQQQQRSMMYNNGYQYSSPVSSQQQPQYYNVSQQQMQYPPYMNSFSPIQGQNYGNNNILGDLHGLQQQVDVLQNVYGRR